MRSENPLARYPPPPRPRSATRGNVLAWLTKRTEVRVERCTAPTWPTPQRTPNKQRQRSVDVDSEKAAISSGFRRPQALSSTHWGKLTERMPLAAR